MGSASSSGQGSVGSASSSSVAPRSSGSTLQATIYKHIHWREARKHFIAVLPGRSSQVAKTLEKALELAADGWKCTKESLLRAGPPQGRPVQPVEELQGRRAQPEEERHGGRRQCLAQADEELQRRQSALSPAQPDEELQGRQRRPAQPDEEPVQPLAEEPHPGPGRVRQSVPGQSNRFQGRPAGCSAH